MSFSTAIRTCFAKYVIFSGRASRPEYWWFILFIVLGNFVAGVIDGVLFNTVTTEAVVTDTGVRVAAENNGPIGTIFALATFIPSISAGWRRMHDTGRSGLYLFYPVIVMIGIGTFAAFTGAMPSLDGGIDYSFDGITGLILIFASIVFIISPFLVIWWLTRPSQPGANEYGPNPREVTS